MFRTNKSQFDYQSIIEACGIQDVNIEKALEGKGKTVTKFNKQVEHFKRLCKERDQKRERLSELKAQLKKHLQEVMDMCSKRSILNRQYKKVQQEILQLNLKLQQKSKEFVNKIKTMDNELKKLYSQFDGGTLMTILSELNSKLLAAEDEETVLQRSYQELENTPVDLSGYEKLKAIEAVISEKFQERTFEEIEQILANKRKNIQFLVGEYNKFLDKLNLYCN